MDTRRALLVDAFTSEPLSGNAAGVVPDAEGLDGEQMQAMANELGASETAFLLPSDDADRKVRYFTPTQEVDLCGHATIASHGFLAEEGELGDEATLETNVGVLDIDIEDGTVWMTQDTADVERVDLDYQRVADALGADPATLEDIGADLPLATATTGLPFLVVPVNFLEGVSNLDPDMSAVAELTDELGVTGVYAFTFDALDADSTLHGRMFAPAAGVDEDPVTGTASGAVGAYLREVRAFDGELPEEMTFEQGHFIDRPGTVRVRARADPVSVGGRAVTALDGSVVVPEFEADDIIEA
ncbi:PhzF family phenazine biosynthesis protein [Natronomonas gomsonensis]|jgi:trans-2,3-dihydro-3-hydroxyanthranilate isomerase|uniref:PhzF family phenazine biosynthesis protein n=1 Tax=Natronomonas gomsonensis TaxID=1046043 RepID=UPI0020CA5666|nr:PhzF family phenazine biosynthesis protein [Natronomonas gomsonensis]MCY4730654.1 PhzF family phenazine biosynthesis protein [Natronomonas gomsonensis]